MEDAGSLRGIAPEDVLKLRFVAAADLSPDGRRVVYAETRTEQDAPQDRVALFLVDVESGARRQLTAGPGTDIAPSWSPDGSQVAFVSDRTGVPQVFVIAADGGEARQLTALPLGVSGTPAWSPDGRRIAFSALSGERRDPSLPYRVTRAFYRLDRVGYVQDALLDIHVVDAAGGEPRRLTEDDRLNSEPRWTPDGSAIAYLAACDPRSAGLTNRLRVVDLEGGGLRDVEHPEGLILSMDFAPDGRLVLLQGLARDRPIGSHGDVLIADLASGRAERRTAAVELSVAGGLQPDYPAPLAPPAVCATAGGEALAVVQVGGRVGVHAFSLDGPERCREVLAGDRCIKPLRLRGARLLFHSSSVNEPGDLHVADLDGGERRLTELNAGVLAGRSLPAVERLAFEGADGTAVEGWFLRPAACEAPHPTVLYVHGGPHGGFGHVWSSDMQLLCGAGFGVLMVNQRGSTGYGDRFATSLSGHWGEHDYLDLMAGVDRAIASGLADGDRLGVCGISGGGNLTCWIVGQTDRFKAAVPENPVTNFLSFWGVADIGPWFAGSEMGAEPWERAQEYLRQSPISHAHRCRTPTLLIQGESDLRCPPEQSEQFYAVLKANGCVVEMLRIPGSAHTGTIDGAVPARTAQNQALLDWMQRYLT